MFKRNITATVSLLSAGIGGWAGIQLERKRYFNKEFRSINDSTRYSSSMLSCDSEQSYFPYLPVVSAKSLPANNPTALTVPAENSSSLHLNRTSEIMKYGFPGLENLRTYDDYVLSYDRRNRTANWVFEHLTKERVQSNNMVSRENIQFYEDTSVHEYFRATNEDYKKSGFDRGHLAAAGNHKSSQKALNETFVLANIAPQVGKGFNRDGWNTLEKYVRHLTKSFKNVYVCTGPLYLPRRENDGKKYVKYEVIGKNHVAVPTHFFKVAVCEGENGELELLSFVMPNTVLPEKIELKHYLVPLDSIERAAGLLLFDRIPRNRLTKINGKRT